MGILLRYMWRGRCPKNVHPKPPRSIKCIRPRSRPNTNCKILPGTRRPYFSFSWQIFTFLRLEILQIFDTFRPEPSGARLFPPLDGGRPLLLLFLLLLLLLLLLLSGPDLLSPPARLPPASGRHRGPLLQLLLPPLLPPLPPPSGVVSGAAPRVFTPSVLCRSTITCQRQMGLGWVWDGWIITHCQSGSPLVAIPTQDSPTHSGRLGDHVFLSGCCDAFSM